MTGQGQLERLVADGKSALRARAGGSHSCLSGERPLTSLYRGLDHNFSDLLLLLTLFLVSALSFTNIWGCYFYGDDFIHLEFLRDLFQHHLELLPRIAVSCFLDPTFELLWRPLVEYSLALDYLVWGGAPFGYHLTNFLSHSYCTGMLYLVAIRLLPGSAPDRRRLVAFFAAAVFAALPLHGEVVVWPTGRVDSFCTGLFLTSLWLFMSFRQNGSRVLQVLCLLAFALSLLSKETAVVFPATALSYCFVFGAGNLPARAVGAILETAWLWLALAAYFACRVFVLGTAGGGYVGSISEVLDQNIWQRWLNTDYWLQLANPINLEAVGPGNFILPALHILYLLAGLTLACRIILAPLNRQALAALSFASLWLIFSMVPVYKIWHLTGTLIGGRYFYLGSTAASLILSLLLLPLSRASTPGDFMLPDNHKEHSALSPAPKLAGGFPQSLFCSFALDIVAILVAAGFVLVFAAATLVNNRAWIDAGDEARNIQHAAAAALARLPARQKLVIVNLPQNWQGAHLFYNFSMLRGLLSPPIYPLDLRKRLAAVESRNYVAADITNVSRLRSLLGAPDRFAIFAWSHESGQLRRLALPSGTYDVSPPDLTCIQLSTQKGEQVFEYRFSFRQPLCPLSVEFLDVELALAPPSRQEHTEVPGANECFHAPGKPTLTLCFGKDANGRYDPLKMLSLMLPGDSRKHVLRFCLGQQKKWLAQGDLTQLSLFVNAPGRKCDLVAVHFLDGRSEIPSLQAQKNFAGQSGDGVCHLSKGAGCLFHFDCSAIPNAAFAVIESSRPHGRFVHYAGTYRESRLSARSLWQRKLSAVAGDVFLSGKDFPCSAFYQVRLAAFSAKGAMLGYVSDPLTLGVSNSVAGCKARSVYEVGQP